MVEFGCTTEPTTTQLTNTTPQQPTQHPLQPPTRPPVTTQPPNPTPATTRPQTTATLPSATTTRTTTRPPTTTTRPPTTTRPQTQPTQPANTLLEYAINYGRIIGLTYRPQLTSGGVAVGATQAQVRARLDQARATGAREFNVWAQGNTIFIATR